VDGSAEEPHADDVQRLALDVLATHEDLAGQPEERGHGRGRDPVLSGAGLGNDPRLAHAARQQDLAERVVDLVRAGVAEVLTFEIDAGAAERAAQALGLIQERRPAGVLALQDAQLATEARVPAQPMIGALQLGERRHERFAHVSATVRPEVPAAVRQPWHGSRRRAAAPDPSDRDLPRRRCTRRRRADEALAPRRRRFPR